MLLLIKAINIILTSTRVVFCIVFYGSLFGNNNLKVNYTIYAHFFKIYYMGGKKLTMLIPTI